MAALREYAISVVTAALLCGILSAILPNCSAKEWIRLLCGLFLTVTVLRPISTLRFDIFEEWSVSHMGEAEQTAAMGEKMAGEAMTELIKAESEAYILDKAAALNAELTVDITVGDDRIPVSAALSGEIAPYARTQLESILETDLGITKENQTWTG